MLDPTNPRTWFVLLVKAVAGLRQNANGPATRYLRFVAEHRGRAAAVAAIPGLRRMQRHPAWTDCASWLTHEERSV